MELDAIFGKGLLQPNLGYCVVNITYHDMINHLDLRRGRDGRIILGLLYRGAIFALVSTLLGDIIGSWIDGVFDLISVDFFKPIISASAITTFGAAVFC
ncbi:hypothetical protein RE628_22245 [Paenibacillus sp. D2_2]|uniref:hypothetical protein n=1 Tax=Paenibacillus sp. D2_2 TaxID=3073092 RepID=UPI002816314D|nr:hypothetical protein [Paenibacillus sp. D2_2]WMT40024.1 hypothetical protein RE628_22245 [Paenibacillus sp. D2_2]